MAESDEKERLTLWLSKPVKDELKKQAQRNGVSASAFISMLISERKNQETKA